MLQQERCPPWHGAVVNAMIFNDLWPCFISHHSLLSFDTGESQEKGKQWRRISYVFFAGGREPERFGGKLQEKCLMWTLSFVVMGSVVLSLSAGISPGLPVYFF